MINYQTKNNLIVGFSILNIMLAFFCLASVQAGEAKKSAGKTAFKFSKSDPINITSDRMEVDRKSSNLTYNGRVVLVQGEMTMKSDKLTAYYDANEKGLKEVVAEGAVQVIQTGRTAQGQKAVYNHANQTITLTGNPLVRQGGSEISGHRIVFFVEEERALVEGGSQRVKATILPDELQKLNEESSGKKNDR